MKRRDVSEGRKIIYYVGMAIGVAGLLCFLSIFVSIALNFGNFSNFDGQVQSFVLRAIGGMAMMMLGSVLAVVGRLGAAGAGIILDPQQARKDLEPWSRSTGGMIKDGLDEAGIDLSGLGGAAEEKEDFTATLRKLHALKEEGILSEAEYEREKAEILENN